MKVEIGNYPDDDSIHDERIVDVRIDRQDTWNMDETLAYIILPMLKQLKDTKHGSPIIDDEDVPHLAKYYPSSNERMQGDLFDSEEQDQFLWDQYETRWGWVIDEMIFAFDSLVGEGKEWEDQFWSGDADLYFVGIDDSDFCELKRGPNHTLDCDMEGMKKYSDRIANGFRLFGKYYQGLWD
jgi:hypothetical protein